MLRFISLSMLLVLLFSFFSCSSDGPETVIRDMVRLMDALNGVLEQAGKDANTAARGIDRYITENGSRIKALVQRLMKVTREYTGDPTKIPGMNDLRLRMAKLSMLVGKFLSNSGFRAVWSKYRKLTSK